MKNTDDDPKSTDMLSTAEVAKLAGVSVNTLSRWREEGAGPPVYRLGPKTHRYRRHEVIAWIQAKRTRPLIP